MNSKFYSKNKQLHKINTKNLQRKNSTTSMIQFAHLNNNNNNLVNNNNNNNNNNNGNSHGDEDELGASGNIYNEHRSHLEQDKKARKELDTFILEDELYDPILIPDLNDANANNNNVSNLYNNS